MALSYCNFAANFKNHTIMRKITIKNVTPENKSKNRLQKVFSFPKEEDIARDFFGWISAEHPLTLNGLTYDKSISASSFRCLQKQPTDNRTISPRTWMSC